MTSTRTWIAAVTVALAPFGFPAHADDAGCLVVAAWGEARGEPLPIIEAVVSTIVNRARARGLSVCDAVMDPAAFTGVTPAMHELFVEATKPKGQDLVTEQPHTGHERAQLAAVEAAAAAALAGQLHDRSNGATHFYSPAGMRELGMKPAPSWASTMVRTATLGPFVFLKEKRDAPVMEASLLPPVSPIVTWADPSTQTLLPIIGTPLAKIEAPDILPAPSEPASIDFGTIDIVTASRPPVPFVVNNDDIGLASLDNLMPGPDGIQGADGGLANPRSLDERATPVQDVVVAEEEPPLTIWRNRPPMPRLRARLPDIADMVDILPIPAADEGPVVVADAAENDSAATADENADTAEAAPTPLLPSGTGEPPRVVAVVTETPRSEDQVRSEDQAWPSVPQTAGQESPVAAQPDGRLSAVSAWSPPGDLPMSRQDTATDWDEAPAPRRYLWRGNFHLWSPEPGTVLACRGPNRGAVLIALHGTRVPRQIVERIRCS